MSRKKKKHGEEEHENNERWLVSYADFITLLFAFFVTMYSVSRVDGKKMGSAVESLQRALGSVMPIQMSHKEPGVFPNQVVPIHFSISPPIEGKAYNPDARALVKMAEEIKKGIENVSEGKTIKPNSNMANQIKFIIEKRGLVIRISEHIFFNSGEAMIRPDMEPVLNILAQTIEKIPNHIRIEGHTDNIPINTSRFPSNWELSTARATMIVRYLLDHFRFDPDRLSATGYAEFRPVDTNSTAEGRLQNRRVDFVILSNKEMESEPQKETTPEQKNST
ncbi:MAG: flagellar basal body stator protein MotB [Deltaproteobacteria bacterium]|nr:flagellar basal body stator protein MotB [Deltaproteobacteria bacterium]